MSVGRQNRRRWSGCSALWAGLIAALAVLPGHAARAQQRPFQSFDSTMGLRSQDLYCLTQSRAGYVFVCSDHGLFVYDGERFDNLGPEQDLPDGGLLLGLAITPDQRLVLRYANDVFVSSNNLTTAQWPSRLRFLHVASSVGTPFDTQPGQVVPWRDGAIIIDRGRLAEVRPGFKPGSFVLKSPADLDLPSLNAKTSIVALYEHDQKLWVASDDGQVCQVDSRLQCIGPQDGLPKSSWQSMLVDRKGRLIVRSRLMVARISLQDHHIKLQSLPVSSSALDSYAKRDAPRLAEMKGGDVLTSTDQGLFGDDGEGWHKLDSALRFQNLPVVALLVDQASNFWVATFGAGLFEARDFGVWENWTTQEGLSNNNSWQFAREPAGPLWVASDGGLDAIARVGNREIISRHLPGAAYSVAINDLHHLWRSLPHSGLARVDLRSGETERFALPPVNKILCGPEERLWFVTEGGLFETDDAPGPASAPVRSKAFSGWLDTGAIGSHGRIWLLGAGRLLVRRPDGTIETVVDRWVQPGFLPGALAIGRDGTLWVGGTGGGLFHVTLSGDKPIRIERISPSLISSTVFSVMVDHRGWIWAGSDAGVSVFDGKRWVTANASTGLIGDNANAEGLFEDTDGSVWVSTTRGVSHILRPEALFKKQPIHPAISSITIGNRQFVDRAVDYTRDPLVIQFGALDARSDVRFRYKLDGADANWGDTALAEARYPYLPYGHHRFTLIAYDPLTRQSSPPVSVVLRMRPPWYRFWPLQVIYAALVGLLVFGLWRLRYRYMLAQQSKLQREVDRRTRELQSAQAALIVQATQDSLTGLLTRGEIQRRLVEALAAPPGHLAVGLLDIDHFKRINDEIGHLAGDEILREIGRRLKTAFRPGEEAGRYGGEEILIVLGRADGSSTLRMHELKFVVCSEPFCCDDGALSVTCSIGVARVRRDDSWKSLIGRADKALYRAKAEGRDRVIDADVISPRETSPSGD